ncbi:uncharacterized protein LOC120420306 [Culex pipiens pallens]|uniref:uncharacterized protein LOC120420306 n=1 Tax=Culex pipiens pallens TaxID=42434 RepID=UPI001954AD6A|nr:uncharacterized protein LOC120420306 [Culex pipiens pallens]
MNGTILLRLVMVLVPAALAQIPTGCVKIRSVHSPKFVLKYKDSEQKIDNCRWNILPDGAFHKIKLETMDEELYESKKSTKYGNVFTYNPKSEKKDKGKAAQWIVTKARGDKFHIKNVKYDHCMMAKGGTVLIGDKDCDGEKYEWLLEACG